MKNAKQPTNQAPIKSERKQQPSVSSPNAAPKETAAPKAKSNPSSRPRQGQPKKSGSKQDRVVAMLRRLEGATVAAVMKATGWQKHSVHGFFAGVVRKKLGLNLLSEEIDGKRVYRIAVNKRGKAGASSRKRAA